MSAVMLHKPIEDALSQFFDIMNIGGTNTVVLYYLNHSNDERNRRNLMVRPEQTTYLL